MSNCPQTIVLLFHCLKSFPYIFVFYGGKKLSITGLHEKERTHIVFAVCSLRSYSYIIIIFKLIKTFDLKCVNKIEDTMEIHINMSH